MKLRLMSLALLLLAAAVSAPALAVAIGEPAPDFTLTDSNGKTRSLSEYRGKVVVLEWNNPGCPFVHKHYESGNIPKQQAEATAAGVVWLTINSGADGKQGHVDGARANAFLAQYGAKPTAYLLDPNGKVGHLYGARTTPHMFVIDSIASTDKEDIAKATQYVPQALSEIKAGKTVSVTTSLPYGCGVKYDS